MFDAKRENEAINLNIILTMDVNPWVGPHAKQTNTDIHTYVCTQAHIQTSVLTSI